jgi:biotin carboxyl carrier protein
MREYNLKIGTKEYKAEVKNIGTASATIIVNDTEYDVELQHFGEKNKPVEQKVARPAASGSVSAPAAAASGSTVGSGNNVLAPLPGQILEISAKEGDVVKAGQQLLVMEAMKMENVIQAPNDGTVGKFYVQVGQTVSESERLVEVTPSMMTTM